MKLPLPSDTQAVIKDKSMLLKTSNLGLLFSKYIYSWQSGWQMKEEDSREFRQAVSKMTFVKEHIANLAIRQQATLQSMKSSGWHVESFNANTDSRLIIGLGGTSVIETGMTLHPLYGFPYLPGSGLKGLARAYAEIALETKPSGDELREIFGSEDKDSRHAANNRQGKVFFMDGLPTSFPKLDLDIMNPHYGDYYSGKKDTKGNPIPPADYLNPVPVTFLTVAKDQTFSFAVFSRDKELTEKAKSWLIGGLTELGAGGKTNVGYGYFRASVTKIATATDTGEETSAKRGSSDSLMEKLLRQASQCRQPGEKSILVQAFEEAKALPTTKREEFLKKAKEVLPSSMKQNAKIKAFLKEKEDEFKK